MPNVYPSSPIYEAVGRFLVSFARLETHLRFTLLDVLSVQTGEGLFIVRKMDAKIITTKLRTLLKQTRKFPDDVKLLFDLIQEVIAVRNQVVHGAPEVDTEQAVLWLAPFGADVRHESRDVDMTAYRSAYLNALQTFCHDAIIDLGHIRICSMLGRKISTAGRATAGFPEGLPTFAERQHRTILDRRDQKLSEEAKRRLEFLQKEQIQQGQILPPSKWPEWLHSTED